MDKLVVTGSVKLKGHVAISGSKNSALPILAAALLTPERGIIHNVPDLTDIRKMRASICILGPLVARCRKATISLPGGCVIGDRPIDIHLKGLEALGAVFTQIGGDIICKVSALRGAEVNMGGKFGSTVLGTDN